MWPVLRVAGPDFDVDAFLAEFRELRPENIWHCGEPSRRGPLPDSGFSVAVEDATTAEEAMALCRREFAGFETALTTASARGATNTLDIGMTIDLPDVVARFVRFSNEDLHWLAGMGVSLELSVYIASSDEAQPPS